MSIEVTYLIYYSHPMDWLNYHHLHYFWVVAHEGGLSHASRKLRISHSAIRAQLDQLEAMFGHKLFRREGRQLVLTDPGKVALRYADEIFNLGQELLGVITSQATPFDLRLRLGLAHVIPKTLVYQLLEPALLEFPDAVVSFSESQTESLCKSLVAHELDALILDTKAPAQLRSQLFHHLIGKSTISFLLEKKRYKTLKVTKFPECLGKVPMLMPTQASSMRREIDGWLASQNIYPPIQYEFDDSALLKVFGEAGHGVFPVPTWIEERACQHHQARVVGRSTSELKFFLVTGRRKITHPILTKIAQR